MTEKRYPSDLHDKFMLRMPDGLRKRIAAAARTNKRSMNQEIVLTLEEHYPPQPSVEEIIEELEDVLRGFETTAKGNLREDLLWFLKHIKERLAQEKEAESLSEPAPPSRKCSAKTKKGE